MNVLDYGFPAMCYPAKSYMLDSKNRFVWFSPEWNLEFQPLFQEPYDVAAYVGQNFFDLLTGPSIRLIYKSLFELIRQPESPNLIYTLPCHIFPRKVLITQELSRQPHGHLAVQFKNRPAAGLEILAEEESSPGETPLKMCSQCRAVYDQEHNQWMPIEKALSCLALFRAPQIPPFSHSYCPLCVTLIRGKRHEYSCSG